MLIDAASFMVLVKGDRGVMIEAGVLSRLNMGRCRFKWMEGNNTVLLQ
jgi:hypothetical protein